MSDTLKPADSNTVLPDVEAMIARNSNIVSLTGAALTDLIEQTKDKPIHIFIGASWCPHCVYSKPFVLEAFENLNRPDKGILVLVDRDADGEFLIKNRDVLGLVTRIEADKTLGIPIPQVIHVKDEEGLLSIRNGKGYAKENHLRWPAPDDCEVSKKFPDSDVALYKGFRLSISILRAHMTNLFEKFYDNPPKARVVPGDRPKDFKI